MTALDTPSTGNTGIVNPDPKTLNFGWDPTDMHHWAALPMTNCCDPANSKNPT